MMTPQDNRHAGRMRIAAAGALLAWATCIPAALAQPTAEYLVQQSEITVLTDADGVTESAAATDFAPFVATLDRQVPFTIGGVSGTNISVASISCTFDQELGIRGRARLESNGADVPGAGTIFGNADVVIDCTVQINTETPFRVRIDTEESQGSAEFERIEFLLVRSDGHVVVTSLLAPDVSEFDRRGILPPGIYRFVYDASLSSAADSCNRDVDVRFEINDECPSDWDESGGIDGDDIVAFFTDWQAGNADIDQSGGTDGDDIAYFFERWQVGC